MTEHTEAPVVFFTQVKTPAGFTWNVTFRGKENADVFNVTPEFENRCKERGWTPVEPRSGQFPPKAPKVVEFTTYACPLCQAKVVKETLGDGRKLEKCSTQKYDFATKTKLGCSYTKWI